MIPKYVIDEAARLVKTVSQSQIGLVIWKMARKYSGYSQNSEEFEKYKHELASALGSRGANAAAKKIRQESKQQQELKF